MSSIQRWTTICNGIQHKLLAAESKRDEILAKISELPPIPPRPTPETSARESILALKAMLENQAARQKLLRPFEPPWYTSPLNARRIADGFMDDLRSNHRSTEMLAEQLHRILPAPLRLTAVFARLLGSLEKLARVRYRELKPLLECAMQQVQLPSFCSDMSAVDDYLAIRYEAHEPSAVPLQGIQQSDECLGIETSIMEATVDLPAHIKQHALFERQILELLWEADRAGIRTSRQALFVEFIRVEYPGVHPIFLRDSRESYTYRPTPLS